MHNHRTEDLHTIKKLNERIWILEEAINELLIYASPTHAVGAVANALCKDGYTSELVPRLTRIGPVNVADRVEAIRKLVTTRDPEAARIWLGDLP